MKIEREIKFSIGVALLFLFFLVATLVYGYLAGYADKQEETSEDVPGVFEQDVFEDDSSLGYFETEHIYGDNVWL